ncbi:uncharacterized protein LOC131643026 [Vicia villosa]|uniref:uncharacterized protein LOC131642366 n=2 Tax=Vicia villosa TaxID=3911 RepID=UPI00273C984C|nr:uncharacterized protein LOC131642366 [Vicia villosa]XP_058768614.1 uncharacterized protein LOC131642373 [Vicia villosa]XP_058769160.1 uncharacterized protein LOC131643026 [Vicia villosa]
MEGRVDQAVRGKGEENSVNQMAVGKAVTSDNSVCHEPVVDDFSCHVEQPAKLQYCIWKQDVSNGKMAQSCLLEIPEHVVASRWLHGARFVDLVDWEREVRYECEVHHTEKGQMFLGRGWYKFAKERCLLDGDSMGFSVKDPISKEILVTMLKY